MTAAPAEPDPDPDDERVPTGDPGHRTPDPAPGSGPGEDEPDVMQPLDEPPD